MPARCGRSRRAPRACPRRRTRPASCAARAAWPRQETLRDSDIHGGSVLVRQRRHHVLQRRGGDGQPGEHATHHARIRQVDDQVVDRRGLQHVERQFLDLQIGLQSRVAEDLRAELQGLARTQSTGPRMQNRPAITKACHVRAVQQMGVDARGLRRGVGTQPERAAAELVDQLEGLQIECLAGARQQRLQVLEQRRDDQLEAVASAAIEQAASQLLDTPCLGGQYIGDVLGQQPR